MFAKTSRMLSACAFAAMILAAGPAMSGGHMGHHGRHAGPGYAPVTHAKFGFVNVYRGGYFHARSGMPRQSRPHPHVTVYYGGGLAASQPRMLDTVEALNVVTVTRGANRRGDHPAVIVTRGMTLSGGVGYIPD